MDSEFGEPEGPLDVDGIAHLASSQGLEFWLRELCMQIAALREQITGEMIQVRATIRAEGERLNER